MIHRSNPMAIPPCGGAPVLRASNRNPNFSCASASQTPTQAMSRMEALKSYTIACAYAAFEEDITGSLTPGKLADIVVLSKDILTVPEDQILQARVLYTIVGGKVVYGSGE